jgi:hypothetical protein
MQYKIPVQIENEDTIFLGLSLRQIIIIMIGSGFGYMIFKSLEGSVGPEIAAIPLVIIVIISLFVALFKNSEMTFLPFILNVLRLSLNENVRVWNKGVASFSNLEIGWVTSHSTIKAKMETK